MFLDLLKHVNTSKDDGTFSNDVAKQTENSFESDKPMELEALVSTDENMDKIQKAVQECKEIKDGTVLLFSLNMVSSQ